MPLLGLSLTVVTFVAAFAAGALCIVWPERVREFMRKRHVGNPLTQNFLFFSTVRRFWDSAYFLPGMGLVAWSVALGVAWVSIFPK